MTERYFGIDHSSRIYSIIDADNIYEAYDKAEGVDIIIKIDVNTLQFILSCFEIGDIIKALYGYLKKCKDELPIKNADITIHVKNLEI